MTAADLTLGPSNKSSRTLSVAEKIKRLEESAAASKESDEEIAKNTPTEKSTKKKNESKGPFWSLSGPSPLSSKKDKAAKKPGKTAADSDAGDESSMGNVSSPVSKKKTTKPFKKIKRSKSANSDNHLDNSAETVSSADSTLTSNTESERQRKTNRKKKKPSKEGGKKSKKPDNDQGDVPAQPARRKASTDCKDDADQQDSGAKSRKISQASSAEQSPTQNTKHSITRTASSPNLTTPTGAVKRKVSNVSPWRKVDVSPTNKNSPTQDDRLPMAAVSPGKTSPKTNNSPSNDSDKKLSPWKDVDVSPADSNTSSSVPKQPASRLSPLPGPPLSLQKMDTTAKDAKETAKRQAPKKSKAQSIAPKNKASSRSSLPPPPQRGLARALSSPILTSPTKKLKKKIPILATASRTCQKQKAKGAKPSRRGLDRTTSSPVLSSPTKKKKKKTARSLSPKMDAVKCSPSARLTHHSDDRPKKHKPITRRNMLHSSSSRRVVKRSSSSDDALDRMRGSLHGKEETRSTKKVSLRPQSGRQLERDLSAGNVLQSQNGRGRSVPGNRGVQRYSSAPMTAASTSLASSELHKGGRGILRSISEDSAEDPTSPLARKGGLTSPSRRANYNRAQSVPVMGSADEAQVSQRKLSGANRPPPRRRRINRTRSDDVSSLARSLHNPITPQRRNSFDEPLKSALKPQGILRKSSHHDAALNPQDEPQQGATNDVGFASSADVYYGSSDDEEEFSVAEETIQFERLKTPAMSSRPGLSRASSSSGSNLNLSLHSFMTTRSMLSVDKEFFDDDPEWKKALRWLRLLPPHKDEKPLKKKIRIFTWLVLLFDFIAAMVAVTTYDGATTCCGEPIFSMLINLNWDVFFRVITYLYLILIFAEIVPVVRQGLPFNILNPTLGFAITFAMFFDDSVAEAVAMWIIEATAIFFEFLIYRTKARLFREETERLAKTDSDLAELNKSRRESKRWLQKNSSHGGSLHGSRHSMPFSTIEEGNSSDDDESDIPEDS
ncbi:MAG: hypothetical protein SGILL_005458 [Bacillariaceae sp.]